MWLGKVHVEAPTIGSIILAGIALKTGFYLHYLFLNLFVYISNHLVSIGMLVLLIGLIVNNINIFYQIDMKRWIALYSIVHMNLYYILLLLVLYNVSYIVDISYICMIVVIIYGMIGHSLISGGLFLIVGYLYDVSYNKNILNVNNNIVSSYLYFVLFILLLANSSFPFFILFIFELLALTLSSLHNMLLVLFLVLLSFSNLLSCLYMFCKYFFNHTSNTLLFVTNYDLLVLIISLPIVVLTFGMGINLFLPISYLI
jgi:NADH-quinone oxidoreductase subunit M